jgi:energy-converting hydrogenase A subunit M
MSVGDDLKLFGMHNLILESELRKLEESGLQIDHIKTIKKEEVLDVELFEQDILKQARKMADFYELYYSLENSIRRLILERLSDKHGANWWKSKVPEGVQKAVKEKQQDERDTTMSIRSEDPLSYTNFGELISIFEANWDDFSDTLRSKKAMQTILSQFNKIRNVVAHSCELNDDEITRFKLLMKDWFRIQS